MTFTPEDKARHVVPRWRPSRSSGSAQELTPTHDPHLSEPGPDEDFEALESAFHADPAFWTAADLVSTAVARGIITSAVHEAAQLVSRSQDLTSAARKVLNRLEHNGEPGVETTPLPLSELDQNVQRRVRTLRTSLKQSPRNALRWLDLGLAHLTLGNLGAADQSIRSALTIAPLNRVVLRSTARFFVHTRREDEALYWLERSGRVANDPWIMAAHLAVSQVAETPLKHFRAAREMLTDGSLAPFSSSELFAVVASEELHAGRGRPARMLMTSALRQPTENSIAQAIWSLEKGLSGVEVDRSAAPRAYEAQTLSAMQSLEWQPALVAVESWLTDEPFSARAAMHASYIAFTGLEDYERGLNFVRRGLRTSPGDPVLLNNAAFALANLGRTTEAWTFINRVTASEPQLKWMADATRGLIHFRSGELAVGRALYRRATAGFKKDGPPENYALCLTMWAREEMRAHTEIGDRLFADASALAATRPNGGARIWADRIRRQLLSNS